MDEPKSKSNVEQLAELLDEVNKTTPLQITFTGWKAELTACEAKLIVARMEIEDLKEQIAKKQQTLDLMGSVKLLDQKREQEIVDLAELLQQSVGAMQGAINYFKDIRFTTTSAATVTQEHIDEITLLLIRIRQKFGKKSNAAI